MADAKADVKLGSLVREEAMCCTRSWNCTEPASLRRATPFWAVAGEVRSRVTVPPEEATEGEQGAAPPPGLEPTAASAWEGCGWLWTPSYVATRMDRSSALLCT